MSTINTYSDIFRRDKLDAKFQEIDDTIYVEEVSLTAANIIAMNATPVTVIAAKGAGKIIEVVGCVWILDAGATAFTGGGAVNLQNESADQYLSTITADNVTSATDIIVKFGAPTTTTSLTANEAIQITNGTAAFANGDGVARLKIAYRVHDSGL